MSFFEGKGYVEGVHRFIFDPGYLVCRIECSSYYSKQAQNFCGGCKEMDFLLYHPVKKELWLIEVKDYRFDARPKGKELIEALCRKVRDSLFLIKSAASCAPHEIPLEGVSLRDFSRQAAHAETVRLGFLLELSSGKLFPTGTLMSNIHSSLLRQMRFIDSELVCAPITHPHRLGPWRVISAHGESSKRVEERRRKKEEERRQEAKKREEEQAQKSANQESQPVPMWKKRLEARIRGEGGNHYARRKNRLSSEREW